MATLVRDSPEYRCWANMLCRTRSKRGWAWEYYGSRGIAVCERWRTFENFLADMGTRPPGKSLDRYPNNDGNYEPRNCRWATSEEQNNNRRPPIRKKWHRLQRVVRIAGNRAFEIGNLDYVCDVLDTMIASIPKAIAAHAEGKRP